MARISINDIKPLTYEGYLWMSDQEEPRIYVNQPIEIPATTNPFIVEGQLYNQEKGLSYSIKYVDGQYIVQEFIVTEEDLKNSYNEQKEYLANRMDEKWLKFLRYWEKKKDANCMGMPVLTQTKNVFIGFKK